MGPEGTSKHTLFSKLNGGLQKLDLSALRLYLEQELGETATPARVAGPDDIERTLRAIIDLLSTYQHSPLLAGNVDALYNGYHVKLHEHIDARASAARDFHDDEEYSFDWLWQHFNLFIAHEQHCGIDPFLHYHDIVENNK